MTPRRRIVAAASLVVVGVLFALTAEYQVLGQALLLIGLLYALGILWIDRQGP